MSVRTIVELNHDLTGRIEDDPAGFASVVLRYLHSGCEEEAGELRRYGVRRLHMRHHSEPLPDLSAWGEGA